MYMNGNCSKCGKGSSRLGGYYPKDAFCTCREKKSDAKPRVSKPKTIVESSSLSVAEQLVLLVQLRQQGALTEEEFAVLKSRLIVG